MAMSDPESPSPHEGAVRAAVFVMTLVAVGEMLVGVFVLALPREMVLLLIGAALDARALFVARMLGIAVLVLGITWWMVRGDAERLPRYSAGFIVYNIGAGVIFGWAAFAAVQPALPWIACVVHLTAGAAFWALVRPRLT